jgi:NhaP-type Na+/H+ and K+/H+ antiporter
LASNKKTIENLHSNVELLLLKQTQNDSNADELFKNKLSVGEFTRFKEYFTDDLSRAKQGIMQMTKRISSAEFYMYGKKPVDDFKEMTTFFDNVLTRKNERRRLADYVQESKEKLKSKILDVTTKVRK